MAMFEMLIGYFSPQLLFYTIYCASLVSLFYTTLAAGLSPLRSIPGPFVTRFTRASYFYQIWRGDFHKTNLELHRKYGPLVRITPNEYSVDAPQSLKLIYGHSKPFVKGAWYEGQSNPDSREEDLFSCRDPIVHSINRRKVAGLYSTSSLLKMEDAVDNCIFLIEERFREAARRGGWIDLRHWLQCFAFDAIGEITLSKRFGFLDDGCDPDGLMPTVKSAIIQGALLGVFPELHKPVFKVMKFLGGQGRLKVGEFAQKQVQERMRAIETDQISGGEADFLTNLLRIHHEKPQDMSMENVLLTIGGNIGAGSDTTSITLTGIMWHLILNDTAMNTLRAEIDEKAKSGEISDPISFAQAQKLPYLQAVVKEGLRLHPATGLPLWRVVPRGGAEIAGKYFPEGSTIGINAWVAHSNPTIFGDNVDRFEPDRWLSGKENVQRMERNLFTFGHGSRTCIGKNISLMEISKVVPQLVRNFHFETASQSALELENCWFVFQKNVTIRLEELNRIEIN